MKGEILLPITCPKCNWGFYNTVKYMSCLNKECPLYGTKFEKPSIELKKYEP